MALIHSFEKSGNFLFKYRGQIPVILIVVSIPVIWFTNYRGFSNLFQDIMSILAIVFSILGFFIRSYAIATTPKGTSGRNRDEQVAETLNKTGIYSIVRHPLYLGNYFMWIGIVMFTFNLYFVVIVSLAFWLYYERIMFAEERFLEKKFGEDYMQWSLGVPAFIPCFRNYIKSIVPFSMKSVLRREYSGFLATVLCFTFIDLFRQYLLTGRLEWERISVCILGVSVVITLLLRTLKHNTRILDEEGRS